ncbi:uncharacterized protein RHOBADRAFT_45780 [Rhodotorula graminis WP1]|uniref:Uncharacterized protein n=1 Tax=Rhodotorula graminis (strain WP1) TaxID=578459 RepID=A0A0P9F137_RHOGW|nr:uncharacterized protein RHOBADRAFT_45780 [Rhodotorula graminis WP1]KPV73212.1 hypothetical protein RHOBADRAFT_45780 [Rhodotorula graminis WP1]
MSRTQRALSRLSRLRLPSMRAESSRPSLPHTPASSNSVDSRPLKHARRQSRSFSTFFSSPLSPSPSPSPSPAPPSSSSRRIALKRTNSFPALIEYPKSPAASIFPDNLDRDSWGAPRDVTLRLEKANLESTYSPAATTATTAPIVPFPRSAAPTHHHAQTHRSFRLDDDDLVVYDTPPEVSRFSSSTEDHSCDTTTTMSVSSCASSSIVAPLSHRAVLDVFTAPRDSVGEPLDLDYELERGIPRSSPPSPQVYRHQPVVSHPHAYLGDVSMASPTPVPRGPSARKWAKSSTSSSSRDVMDPAMEGFSFAATSAVVLGADALLSSKNRPTPPPTPRIVPVGANTPSPFLLPRPVAAGSPSLSSLILEDLTTEFNKVAPVELPCGFDLPSTPISPSSPVWHGRPVPTFAPSPPSTPRPAAGPDTPTPVAFPPAFPFRCPSPPPSCARKPSRTQVAPLSISPSPLPRTNCPSTSSTCTSTSTSSNSLSPSLTSTSSLSLFSPFTFGSASASASDMGSFPSPPTSPASSTAYYPRGAGRMRPKVLPPSPESVVMVEAVSNRRF